MVKKSIIEKTDEIIFNRIIENLSKEVYKNTRVGKMSYSLSEDEDKNIIGLSIKIEDFSKSYNNPNITNIEILKKRRDEKILEEISISKKVYGEIDNEYKLESTPLEDINKLLLINIFLLN